MLEKHNTKNFAIVLDENGGIKEYSSEKNTITPKTNLWINLNYKDENIREILSKEYNLDNFIIENLCSVQPHQNFINQENQNGIFLVLRSIKSNSKINPDEACSLRIWLDNDKIITLSNHKSSSLELVLDKLKENTGAKNPIECFISISQNYFHNISDTIYGIIEKVDRLEENTIQKKININHKSAKIRKKIINIHRHLLPQKEIFKNIYNDVKIFSDNKYKNKFKDIYGNISKSINNLEYSREHLIILKEEQENEVNISINNNMYILSIIVAVFTPLTLISGVLGMNVKGIPYADSDYAFIFVCILLVITALISFLAIKKIRKSE